MHASTRLGALCLAALFGAVAAAPSEAGMAAIAAVTTDGSCGGTKGFTCGGSFGSCCSASGKCGSDTTSCSIGCQAAFGLCVDQPATLNISMDGICAGKAQTTCKGSNFGDCCSSAGFCGNTTSYCGSGCQANYGSCTSGLISSDGTCGGPNAITCTGSKYGTCCSSSGFCGSSSLHCGQGCQSKYGTCSSGIIASNDGTCGGAAGLSCQGSPYGDCCGPSGYCGRSTGHCGAGCQSKYGNCTASAANVSSDGSCGGTKGLTCAGAVLGSCCSKDGFCGDTAKFCGQGCQTKFSSSCLTKNIPSNDGACGPTAGNVTCAGGAYDGQCCSSSGFCGKGTEYCGTGCLASFGACSK